MKKSTKYVAGGGLALAIYLWLQHNKKVTAARRVAAAAAAGTAAIPGDGSTATAASTLSGATLSRQIFHTKQGLGSLGH